MSRTTDLLVAPCTRAAAKFAAQRWHYSGTLPNGKIACFGVWESNRFIGAIVYGRGANNHMSRPYGLTQTECVELVRIALTEHAAPVTQMIAASLRQLRAACPGLRLVVSYADTAQGHHGGVYQAASWLYTGARGSSDAYYLVNGERTHGRTVSNFARYRKRPDETSLDYVRRTVDPQAHRMRNLPIKHRYIMPLNKTTRRVLRRMHLPYPQRVASA